MKFPIISSIIVAACAFAATAQAELKVASVNVMELYTMFHKRFDVEVMLKEQQTAIRTDIKVREDKLKALEAEIKKIKEKDDPTLSQTARKKLRDEMSVKVNEYQAAAQELQTFQQRRVMAFQEMHRREMIALLTEVQTVVNDAATKGGYDIVIDSSAVASPLNMRVFPHVNDSLNITAEVLKQLNAGAPEGFDPKAELERMAAPQTEAAAPAPAAL